MGQLSKAAIGLLLGIVIVGLITLVVIGTTLFLMEMAVDMSRRV